MPDHAKKEELWTDIRTKVGFVKGSFEPTRFNITLSHRMFLPAAPRLQGAYRAALKGTLEEGLAITFFYCVERKRASQTGSSTYLVGYQNQASGFQSLRLQLSPTRIMRFPETAFISERKTVDAKYRDLLLENRNISFKTKASYTEADLYDGERLGVMVFPPLPMNGFIPRELKRTWRKAKPAAGKPVQTSLELEQPADVSMFASSIREWCQWLNQRVTDGELELRITNEGHLQVGIRKVVTTTQTVWD